jgi:hypothetical protein
MTCAQAVAVAKWIDESGKRLRAIVSTHGHGDHRFGTAMTDALAAGRELILLDNAGVGRSSGAVTMPWLTGPGGPTRASRSYRARQPAGSLTAAPRTRTESTLRTLFLPC